VNQYGFVLPGNPNDRLLALNPPPALPCRLRRDWPFLAADAAAAQHADGGQQVVSPHAWLHAAGLQGGVTARRQRLRCAATSLVSRFGWR
jgi:hypothetical protein